jgi:pectinesterase
MRLESMPSTIKAYAAISGIAAALVCVVGTRQAFGVVHLMVAEDGSGQYTRLQDAIVAAASSSASNPYVIDIKPGTYSMTNNMDQFKVTAPYVTFNGLGSSPADVVLTGNYWAGDNSPNDTYGHATTVITTAGHDFTARNITFENGRGDNTGQALAIYNKGDRTAFIDCRFLGWQDTLRAELGRQYYKNCYVAGDVDFIYGHASAFFDNASIYVRSSGYITAPALLEPPNDYRAKGFVFSECTITGAGSNLTYLGRPWTDGGLVVYDNCKMSSVVRAVGWTGSSREYFAEHHSMDLNGNLLDVSQREAGSHQLTDAQALNYSLSNWLTGPDNWNPAALVPEPGCTLALSAISLLMLHRRRHPT